MSDRFTW